MASDNDNQKKHNEESKRKSQEAKKEKTKNKQQKAVKKQEDKDKNQKNVIQRALSSDNFKTGVVGALAGIGGSVLLHRTGVMSKLSHHGGKAYKFLKEDAGRIINKHIDKNSTISDYKKAYNEIKDKWERNS